MVEIVAEISGNHGGSINKAYDLIWRAAGCGCNHAKFQFYRPEDMPDRYEGDNDAMYRKLMVPDEWLPSLFDAAKQCNIGLFASVFSVRAVEALLKFDAPYIKIASPDSTRLPTATYQAIALAIPADMRIVSTGAADLMDMQDIAGHLMYCPSGHPPIIKTSDIMHFRAHHYMGFSDHSSGIQTPLRFIHAGAMMIEKHFKIDDDCVDAAFSADIDTMKLLCRLAHNR